MTRPRWNSSGESREFLKQTHRAQLKNPLFKGQGEIWRHVQHVRKSNSPCEYYALQCAAFLSEELWILKACTKAGMRLNAPSGYKPPISLLALHEMGMDMKLAMMTFAINNGASLVRCHEKDVAALNVTAEVEDALRNLREKDKLCPSEHKEYEHLELMHDLLLDAKVPALRHEGVAIFRMDDI